MIGNGDEITDGWFMLWVSKKTNKPIKPRKPENKQQQKPNPKKKLITPIKIFFKKILVQFQFQFHKLEIKKTESN